MAWFNKKNRVIDLTQQYRKRQEQLATTKAAEGASETISSSDSSSGGFGVFGMGVTPTDSGMVAYGSSDSTDDANLLSPFDKKRKLAKRILYMTNKMEDLSNQIYHLQQRVEVLEKKGSL